MSTPAACARCSPRGRVPVRGDCRRRAPRDRRRSLPLVGARRQGSACLVVVRLRAGHRARGHAPLRRAPSKARSRTRPGRWLLEVLLRLHFYAGSPTVRWLGAHSQSAQGRTSRRLLGSRQRGLGTARGLLAAGRDGRRRARSARAARRRSARRSNRSTGRSASTRTRAAARTGRARTISTGPRACRTRSAATGCGRRRRSARRPARDADRRADARRRSARRRRCRSSGRTFPKAIEAAGGRPHACASSRSSTPTSTRSRAASRRPTSSSLAFGRDTVTRRAAGLVPPARCSPHADAASGTAEPARSPYLTPAAAIPTASISELVDAAIEGADTFEHKREMIDEYGWRHFGDIYGDHEGVRQHGPPPLVSHYNNQYDPVGGFGVPVPAQRRRPLVDDDGRARGPRHRHRHLPHRAGQVGLQPRPVLAHVSLRRRRHRDAPLVSARRRQGDRRRRAVGGSELHLRPDAALLPHRRRGVARDGDRSRRSTSSTWTTARRRSSGGSTAATPGLPRRPARTATTARGAARPTRSTRCSTATG